jgi:hypothetical protein
VLVPVAVAAGLLASVLSDVLVGAILLGTGFMSWPPPEVAPAWLYVGSGACFGLVLVLVANFIAPTHKNAASTALGIISLLYILPALFAGMVGVTIYPAAVNVGGVSGVAIGVVAGCVILFVRARGLRGGAQ